MSDERRVIGYDVGVGGDGGPVYARADGATGTGDLPAGYEWRAPTHVAYAALLGPRHGFIRPLATADERTGEWITYPNGDEGPRGTATPRPGETLLAAAQRCAEAALWRRDGFGVGEVRDVALPERYWDARFGNFGIELDGLPGLWNVTSTHRVAGTITVDARRVDVRPAGDEVPPVPECGAESFGISCWLDAGHDGAHQSGSARWRGKKSQRSPVPPAIATPASEGTGASATDDAVGLVHEPFAPSARAAAETMEVLRRVGEGDAAELARLLPVLPGDIAGIRSLNYKRGRALFDRVARAAELLTRERDRAHDILRPHHAPTRDGGDMLATLARIVAERSSLRDDRSAALRNVNARNIELTDALGAAEEERDALLARVTDLESALDTAAGSLDGRDDEHAALLARVAELEALLTAPPVGSVAGLLAKMKEARKFARADRGPHIKGIVASYYHAEKMIKATLAAPTDAVGKVVAEAFAEHERIASLGPWDPMDHWAAICTEADSIKAGVAPGRDRLIRVMGEAIAGILACDAAKGGAK